MESAPHVDLTASLQFFDICRRESLEYLEYSSSAKMELIRMNTINARKYIMPRFMKGRALFGTACLPDVKRNPGQDANGRRSGGFVCGECD